jgi:hypothetical protein
MHRAMRRVLLGGQTPEIPKSLRRVVDAVLARLPKLAVVPAYVIGVGVRPERAPEYARRPPQ